MKSWRDTLAVALAGAERRQLDERALLRDAAALSLRRLAGWTPPEGAQPDWQPCPPDQLPAAPSASLGELLESDDNELLREWLALAAASRLVVPPTHLAALLERAKGSPMLRDAVEPVLGERGAWLAGLNPDWTFASRVDPAEAFASGSRRRRLRALRNLRARNPDGARALLELAWPTEAGDDRAALLQTLALNLSPADEGFLARSLADGRKELRQAARDLLALLPDSALAARMRGRAHRYVRFESGLLGGRVEVDPPAAGDAELVADAIDPRAPRGLGERGWLLAQVLSLVPPGEWPMEMLGPALASEWAQPLWQGLVHAAARFQDARWTEALLAADSEESLRPSPFEAFQALPAASKEAIILRSLGGNLRLTVLMVETAGHLWSAELSRAIARHAIAEQAPGTLRRIAYSADPAVLPELERALEGKFTEPPWIAGAVERDLDTLRQRARIRRELTQT